MLWRVTDIQDYSVWATDGDIGELDQFYMDVNTWAVRYLVVDTSAWLPGRKVLVPMIAVQSLDRWGVFHLTLARAQLRHCPPVDPNRPITRATEQDYIHHYGLPLDWGIASGPPGHAPTQPTPDTSSAPYLLSTRELAGWQVQGPGGVIGHIKDCIIDDAAWRVRYLLIGTGRWLPGETVMLPAASLGAIDLPRRQIDTPLTHAQIHAAPAIDPLAPLNAAELEALDHYYRQSAASV
jgi:sporulation protein YlmC with PRC-barrel domain